MIDAPDARLWDALADAADRQTLPRFRAGTPVANKLASGFDPVTEADREAERAIRAILERERPHDAILGEEHGEGAGSSGCRWVIDPIDGTRAFIAGLPVWTTLIGLERDGRAVAGLVGQPVTGERFLARGDGTAAVERGGTRRALKVSGRAAPGEAIVMTTDPALLDEAPGALDALRSAARLVRYGCDAYAFCALAAGTVDLVVELGVQPYDVVAPIALVEAAGGTVTNWAGKRAEAGGSIVAAASPELHEWALGILGPHAPGP